MTRLPAAFVCDREQSRLDVLVKATFDSFTARLEHWEPHLEFDANAHITGARVRFAFADLKTGKEKRDRAMLDWEEASRFPEGEFVLDHLTPDANGRSRAEGRLTIHGVTRPLAFPVTILADGPLCAVDGEALIDTREFGLPVIRMMGLLKVDPQVRVRFHLQGRREES